ncbi:MAG: sugar phosphate isomerase/epimerase [Bernardetiaceae bacterium]|jgi:inosose dehydratase|nr:sugar phosphate isomerase/epimerase [Bernardetiaceae bacterium]
MYRREFVKQLSAAAAASALPWAGLAAPEAKWKFKLGYASITWGGNFEVALKEIASQGFKAMQISGITYGAFKDKPQQLIDLVKASGLQVPVSSAGNLRIEPDKKEGAFKSCFDVVKIHSQLPGAKIVQVTNGSRPQGRQPTTDELKQLASQMNEFGKKAQEELGISVVYHNHMRQLGETPEEVDVILQNCNPKHIQFLLDIAHYQWGGGDPVKALDQYRDLIKVIHLKDLGPVPDTTDKQFMELGQGTLDLPGIFGKLRQNKFKGWGIIEIDAVPKGSGRTPLQCAELCKKYMVEKVGYPI